MMLDDFLIDVSVLLGVPQTVLETGYYMVDLPKIIEAKHKQVVGNRLNNIMMLTATNGRSIEESDYKAYINGLNKSLGVKAEEKFNRDKFEELRAMTNMGANLAR